MKKQLSMIAAALALSATAAMAQDRAVRDEGDITPHGTRAAAFVVVEAADHTHSVYQIPADVVDQGREAVVAAATEANRVRANIVQDEGDIDASRSAWYWVASTYSFGWYGGYNAYAGYGAYAGYTGYGYGYSAYAGYGGYNWYRPVYNWGVPSYYGYGSYAYGGAYGYNGYNAGYNYYVYRWLF
jgi:hypothetical protein